MDKQEARSVNDWQEIPHALAEVPDEIRQNPNWPRGKEHQRWSNRTRSKFRLVARCLFGPLTLIPDLLNWVPEALGRRVRRKKALRGLPVGFSSRLIIDGPMKTFLAVALSFLIGVFFSDINLENEHSPLFIYFALIIIFSAIMAFYLYTENLKAQAGADAWDPDLRREDALAMLPRQWVSTDKRASCPWISPERRGVYAATGAHGLWHEYKTVWRDELWAALFVITSLPAMLLVFFILVKNIWGIDFLAVFAFIVIALIVNVGATALSFWRIFARSRYEASVFNARAVYLYSVKQRSFDAQVILDLRTIKEQYVDAAARRNGESETSSGKSQSLKARIKRSWAELRGGSQRRCR